MTRPPNEEVQILLNTRPQGSKPHLDSSYPVISILRTGLRQSEENSYPYAIHSPGLDHTGLSGPLFKYAQQPDEPGFFSQFASHTRFAVFSTRTL